METAQEPQVYSTTRRLALEANQKAWELLQQPERSRSDSLIMLSAASASLQLWELVGNDSDRARGHWLVSRAYAATSERDQAIAHAKACARYAESIPDDYADQAHAAEAMARALALSGEQEKARTLRSRAEELGSKITDPAVRGEFEAHLQSGPWFGLH